MVVTLNFSLSRLADDGSMAIDPTRLVQGIVGGIGFLGAVAIMAPRDNGRLRGVRSGAAIWVVGAIGVAGGPGYYKEAATITALISIVVNFFDWINIRNEMDKQLASTGAVSKLSHHFSLKDADRERDGKNIRSPQVDTPAEITDFHDRYNDMDTSWFPEDR